MDICGERWPIISCEGLKRHRFLLGEEEGGPHSRECKGGKEARQHMANCSGQGCGPVGAPKPFLVC